MNKATLSRSSSRTGSTAPAAGSAKTPVAPPSFENLASEPEYPGANYEEIDIDEGLEPMSEDSDEPKVVAPSRKVRMRYFICIRKLH